MSATFRTKVTVWVKVKAENAEEAAEKAGCLIDDSSQAQDFDVEIKDFDVEIEEDL